MGIVTKATVKSTLETGDKPTQAQFADFVDSTVFIPFAGALGVVEIESTASATTRQLGAVGIQILASGTTASAQDHLGLGAAATAATGAVGLQLLSAVTTASASNHLGITAGTAEVATYNFTETSDISIATVTPTGTLWSSSQSITIPTAGLITYHFYVRIDNASGGAKQYALGLRINGTDYWQSIDNNGTPAYQDSGNITDGNYVIFKAGYAAGGGGTSNALDIEGYSISTGSQTVQPIVATSDSTATQTLKGATVTCRLHVETHDRS